VEVQQEEKMGAYQKNKNFSLIGLRNNLARDGSLSRNKNFSLIGLRNNLAPGNAM
jgi:hypothetical protein